MPEVLRRGIGWINARPIRTIEWLLAACVVMFVWGLDTHGNYAGSGDDPHYQMIAHSLVFDRDIDLSNDYSDKTNLVGAGTLEPEAHAIPGKDGRLRPVHDIGLPVLFAPYFAVAYWVAEHSPEWLSPSLMARARLNPPLVLRHLLSLAMIALTGLLAVLLFRICRPAFHSHAPALSWILLFILSPPLLSHAYLFFTELPTALLVTACWLTLHTPFHQSRLRTVLLGAGVGFLLLLHIRNVGLVLGLTALCMGRIWALERRAENAMCFLAPIVVFGLVRTAVNVAFWGSLVTSPHTGLVLPAGVAATTTEVIARVLGLLVDQEHGLLAYAPIYVLVLPGFFLLRKTDKKSLSEACLIVLAYLVPILVPSLNRHGWDGGWSPAARFLVPIAPILIVVGLRYLSRLPRIPVAIAVLCLVQGTLNLVYWSHPKLLWNLGTGRSALAMFLSVPHVSVAEWLPCWHFPSVYTLVLSLSVVAVWTVVSARAVAKMQ
jgi:hypothetical protein